LSLHKNPCDLRRILALNDPFGTQNGHFKKSQGLRTGGFRTCIAALETLSNGYFGWNFLRMIFFIIV